MIDMGAIWFIIGLTAIITLTVGWVLTLIRQAKKSEWAWFVLTLLFNPTLIIYWVVKWFK